MKLFFADSYWHTLPDYFDTEFMLVGSSYDHFFSNLQNFIFFEKWRPKMTFDRDKSPWNDRNTLESDQTFTKSGITIVRSVLKMQRRDRNFVPYHKCISFFLYSLIVVFYNFSLKTRSADNINMGTTVTFQAKFAV